MKRWLTCSAVLVSACAARQDPATTQRIGELEIKVAELEARPLPATRTDAVRDARRRPPADPPAPRGAARDELDALQQRVVELERANDELWTQLEKQTYGDLRAVDPAFAPKAGQPRAQTKPDVVYSVPVSPLGPMRGDASARVTWVIGIELTEPFTRRLLETVKQVQQDYGTDLRVVFKHHVVHDFGLTSALVLCAANLQGKFEEALARMLELPLGERGTFRMNRLVSRMGMVDRAQLELDMAGRCRKIVRDDFVFAQRMNQSGVPYSFVNGRVLTGAQPAESFKRLIDEELARANAALGGRSSKGYYDSITKTGQKQP